MEATQTIRVTIDTVKPRTQALSNVRVHRFEFATMRYRVNDAAPSCGRANVTIRIRQGARVVRTLRLGVKPVNRTLSVRVQATLRPGTYRYYVYVTTDLEPAWDLADTGWRVKVTGDASLEVDLKFPVTMAEMAEYTPALTANPPVNAVPFVCAARSGLLRTGDLPPLVPAGPDAHSQE